MPRRLDGVVRGHHNWCHGRLRGCGYRVTFPRQVIMQVLGEAKKHLSAEDIYIEVHKRFPSIGLTTVYRTLELLVRMGMVHKFDFGDGRARFELFSGPESDTHHHHLVCVQCGTVVNYSDFMEDEKTFLKRVEKGLEKKYDFQINSHMIQFSGLCKKCKQ